MKIFQRLIYECPVEILAHVEFDMSRRIDQRPPLKEEKNSAHEVDP